MKPDWNRRYTTIAAYTLIVLAAAILLCVCAFNLSATAKAMAFLFQPLKPLLYGFMLAYILNPVLVSIEAFAAERLPKLLPRWKPDARLRHRLGVLCTMLFFLLVLVTFFWIIIPEIAASVSSLARRVPAFIDLARSFVNDALNNEVVFLPPELVQRLSATVESGFAELYRWLSSVLPSLFNWTFSLTSAIVDCFLSFFVCVYLLLDRDSFLAGMRMVLDALLPPKTVQWLLEVGGHANYIFNGFINGKIIDSSIIGLLCFIGTMLLGFPNAVLVSFIVGITNVIPYFGPFIGAIPGFCIIFIDSPRKAFFFLLFILALQQLDGNVIGPYILGDFTGISAFWVLFAILFFGGLLGIWGMFIGVPLFALIYWLIAGFVRNCLRKRSLSTDIADYVPRPPASAGEPTDEPAENTK